MSPQDAGDVLLSVRGLTKRFPISHDAFGRPVRFIHALNGIDLDLKHGETLGLVGESGCGKTTVGRSLLRLIDVSSGSALFRSRTLEPKGVAQPVDVLALGRRDMRLLRRDMQMIFQDPYSSLNTRLSVATNIGEPLRAMGVGRQTRRQQVLDLLKDVGLGEHHAQRYPHELSGGQRQRVAIARALAPNPQFIVADEAVSALDVSIQAQILNLLADLQARRGLTLLFIAHNLAVVRYISTRIAVMYLGRIVELAETGSFFERPRHPYSQALIDAVPGVSGRPTPLRGEPPSPSNLPSGCSFHPRCAFATERCRSETPALREVEGNGYVSCHHAETIRLEGGPVPRSGPMDVN